jgi:phage gp29-like protein
MRAGLLDFENATVAVGPHGSALTVIHPSGEGSAFRSAFDEFRREIVFAILCVVRATLEAKNSSKADGQIAQDVMGTVVRLLKKQLAASARNDLFRPLVRANFGDSDAELHTPAVQLGMTEMQDFSRNANAVARLASAGLIAPGERLSFLTWLGFGSFFNRLRRPRRGDAQPSAEPEKPAEPGRKAA